MICILSTGEITKDDYLKDMYEEYLKEYGETFETVCDYIPFKLCDDYIYICVKETEYKTMTKETLEALTTVLNNMAS